MDYVKFAAYKALPDGRKKSLLEGQLVESNMGFVRSQARKFMSRSAVKLERDDLDQAGAIGLVRALRNYDPQRSRFSTYAGWFILREMQNYAAQAAPVRRGSKNNGNGIMPFKKWREILKYRATNGGEDPTDSFLELPEGTMMEWRQSPVFFSLDLIMGWDTGTDNAIPLSEKFADISERDTDRDVMEPEEAEMLAGPIAEDGMLHEETKERLDLALSHLTKEEITNFKNVIMLGKSGDTDGAANTLALLRAFLEV